MSETLLDDSKLADELSAFKRHAEVLGQHKLKFPNTYAPPMEHRHKKPTLVNIAVVEPPVVTLESDEGAANDSVTLTIKSIKPALTFTILAPLTSTIASLKQQLAASELTAPPAEQQRWLLKGKAMGGERLLKEFAVEDGSVVTLMTAKPAAAPAPAAAPVPSPSLSPVPTPSLSPSHPPAERHTHNRVPSLTLTEPIIGPPSLTINTGLPLDVDSASNPSSPTPDRFATAMSDPTLWDGAWRLLRDHFGEGREYEAQRAWESWLSGSREAISPGDKAMIRDRVGLSAMGGV